jgi:SAM-dependent methyltransferase
MRVGHPTFDMDRFQNTRQPDWDWWGRLWPTPGETLRRLGVAPGDSLAEVGCGNGYFALPAARIAAPAPVYAVDLDEALLDELDCLAERQGIENVTTVCGDARSLDRHLPERVETVLLANTFHGVADREGFLEGVAGSLHSDGTFLVVNWHDRPREETPVADEPRGPPADLRLTPDETETAVREASDFESVETVELPPYHYAVAFQK